MGAFTGKSEHGAGSRHTGANFFRWLARSTAVAGIGAEVSVAGTRRARTSKQDVVQERTGSIVQETLKSQGDAPLKGVPTIVLVDGGSASASEIVSGALQDHKAAQLVGTKTFGKGSAQKLLDLPFGGQLKVTTEKWYTPNGRNINKEGLVPDIEIKPSAEDITSGNDVQKAKAVELLNK